eukprot:148920-Rhodomonas_salina.7
MHTRTSARSPSAQDRNGQRAESDEADGALLGEQGVEEGGAAPEAEEEVRGSGEGVAAVFASVQRGEQCVPAHAAELYREHLQRLLWADKVHVVDEPATLNLVEEDATVLTKLGEAVLELKVAGLAEKRQSVVKGDRVLVRRVGDAGSKSTVQLERRGHALHSPAAAAAFAICTGTSGGDDCHTAYISSRRHRLLPRTWMDALGRRRVP